MMKICYVADAESAHTQRWVRYFADIGHDVHLISTTSVAGGSIGKVKLHVIKMIRPHIRVVSFPAKVLYSIIQVRKFIKEIEPDILHAHYITDFGFLGVLSSFHPFVMSAWGSDVRYDAKHNRIIKILAQYILKNADVVHVDADHMRDELIRLGVEKEKIRIIYYGTDTKRHSPEKKDESLKQKLGFADLPTVISTRNLEPIYDVESFVNAMPLILKEDPDVRFIIAGDGTQRDYLKDLAKSLGVSEYIRFVGHIPSNELPRYLASSDIYVSTAFSDGGLASSTAEAMACQLPVVITDFGDNRKWVKDSVNGFLVPLKSPEEIASKIIFLLKNEKMRLEFGQVSRQIIEERSEREKEMRKVESLYIELVQRYKTIKSS